MTQPKSTAERLTELETKQALVLQRLESIDLRLSQLVAPGTILDATERLASMERRVTGIETLLNEKVPGFEAVGARVTELSAAFQNANGRLTGLEADVVELKEAPPTVDERRLAEIEQGLQGIRAAVATLSATRGRAGLSGRLRAIEDKLDALLPTPPPNPSE